MDETMCLPYKAPVDGLIVLRVLICEVCRHRSNEPNPINVSWPGWDGPTWPWNGTPADPQGKRCRLCPLVHRLAGFTVDLKALANNMLNDYELTGEFMACGTSSA